MELTLEEQQALWETEDATASITIDKLIEFVSVFEAKYGEDAHIQSIQDNNGKSHTLFTSDLQIVLEYAWRYVDLT